MYIISDEASNTCNAMVFDSIPTVEELDVLPVLPIRNVQLRQTLSDIQSEDTAMVTALRAKSSVPHYIRHDYSIY